MKRKLENHRIHRCSSCRSLSEIPIGSRKEKETQRNARFGREQNGFLSFVWTRLEHRLAFLTFSLCKSPFTFRPNALGYFKSSDWITINYRFFFVTRPVHPNSLSSYSIAINPFPFLHTSAALLAQWASLCHRTHSLPFRSNIQKLS